MTGEQAAQRAIDILEIGALGASWACVAKVDCEVVCSIWSDLELKWIVRIDRRLSGKEESPLICVYLNNLGQLIGSS